MQRRRDGVAVATERARDVERLGERVDAPSNRVVVLLARDRVEQIARGRARRDGASTRRARRRDARRRDGDSRRIAPRRRTPCRRATEWRRATDARRDAATDARAARDDARRRDGDSRRIAPRRRTPCRRATEWRRATDARRDAARDARRARATRRATRPGRARDATSATGDEVFVFGLGYLGRALARALTREGYVVRGTTLDDDDEDDGGAATTTTWRGTRGDVEAIEAMVERATYVIVAVPPARAETGEGWRDPVYDAFARTLSAARADEAGRRRTRFVGYCSTTAVYGDHEGRWVDETSARRAASGTAKTRRDAEERWSALAAAANGELKVVSYRLGGIYGPGRNALETVKRRATGESESASQRARRVARVHESRARARRGEFNRGDDARGRSRERRVQRRR